LDVVNIIGVHILGVSIYAFKVASVMWGNAFTFGEGDALPKKYIVIIFMSYSNHAPLAINWSTQYILDEM
jgi:hypothetical protein